MRAFLDTHAALILHLARTFVREQGERVEPSDVAQEVMVSLLRLHRAGTFDPERIENMDAYLRTVVRNAAHRARTRGSARERVAADGDVTTLADDAAREDDARLASPSTPEEMTRRAHDARRTLEALKATLRPRDALVLALLAEEGLDAEEVAARLGTTLNNVYQMRHRILVAARETLGKEDEPLRLDPMRGAT